MYEYNTVPVFTSSGIVYGVEQALHQIPDGWEYVDTVMDRDSVSGVIVIRKVKTRSVNSYLTEHLGFEISNADTHPL